MYKLKINKMKYEKYYELFFETLSDLNSDVDVDDSHVRSYYDLEWDVQDAANEYHIINSDIEVDEIF